MLGTLIEFYGQGRGLPEDPDMVSALQETTPQQKWGQGLWEHRNTELKRFLLFGEGVGGYSIKEVIFELGFSG